MKVAKIKFEGHPELSVHVRFVDELIGGDEDDTCEKCYFYDKGTCDETLWGLTCGPSGADPEVYYSKDE